MTDRRFPPDKAIEVAARAIFQAQHGHWTFRAHYGAGKPSAGDIAKYVVQHLRAYDCME